MHSPRHLLATCIITLSLIACRPAADPKIAAIHADSIALSLHHATRLIDSARNLLAAKDPAGDSEQISSAVLLQTPLGDSIRSAVRDLMLICHNDWPNPATIVNIDNAFPFTKQLLAPHAWEKLYFSNTPTATAYTILFSMEDECTKAANFTMSRIDGHPR